jgi:acyl-CoA reductase-like NAD-dependent aldehyde dehydrogenase
MQEEIFGPILPVLTYHSFDEAINTINQLDKPLVIYYFGDHRGANFSRLERETSSGTLISNETMFHLCNSDLPFGGVGMSGYGRYHGFEGFKAFSNCKGVMHKPPLNMFPYDMGYPPYTPMK